MKGLCSKGKGLEVQEFKAEDFLCSQVDRHKGRLIKAILSEIEGWRVVQEANLDKVRSAIPKNLHTVVELLLLINDKDLAHMRKRVLDMVNDFSREFKSEISNFDVEFNPNKE